MEAGLLSVLKRLGPRNIPDYFYEPSSTPFHMKRWSTITRLVRSRVAQIAALLPFLGYVVLWSDIAQTHLLKFSALGSNQLLSVLERSMLLYMGSACMLAALLVYWVFCPGVVRQAATRSEFVLRVAQTVDVYQQEHARTYLEPFFKWLDQTPPPQPRGPFLGGYRALVLHAAFRVTAATNAKSLMSSDTNKGMHVLVGAYYDLRDREGFIWKLIVWALLALGTLLFAIPSLEVLYLAAWQVPAVLQGLVGRLV